MAQRARRKVYEPGAAQGDQANRPPASAASQFERPDDETPPAQPRSDACQVVSAFVDQDARRTGERQEGDAPGQRRTFEAEISPRRIWNKSRARIASAGMTSTNGVSTPRGNFRP